ncbi:MAG: ABC transporter permease [Myxococcaceae bacterium]|nr:ABC transporter permease [Myxococcaceae bacterium]MCA3016007.1 ABC transporter permease [Myxococcaceae bacterium]
MSASPWPLVWLSLRRDRRSALASTFGLAVGVASLVFFVALGLGVGRVVREKVFPVDARLVEVVPASFSLGLLGGGVLDEAAVGRLEALPGVARAYRKMNVRAPAVSVYRGDFFGRPLHMGLEVLAVGVEPDFVVGDVVVGAFADPGPDQPIPALASTRLLEIYNKSFAPQRSLPQLSGQLLAGFVFPVEFNRSFVTAPPPGAAAIPCRAQLVGVSDRALLAGITIPLEVARRLNRAANADADAYSAVTLEAKDPSAVPGLVAAVRAMGLEVDDQERRQAERAGAAVAICTSSLALVSLLVCVLAAFNIAHAFSAAVRAREKELGVMRAVGATRAALFRLVFVEALVLGLAGGALGTLVALLAGVAADAAAASMLPAFPFKPESWFSTPAWLLAGGLALGVVAAAAGAFLPARRAAASDPARVLAG